MDEKKLNILKDLLVNDEHSLEDLQKLVQKAKPFIQIEAKSGSIIIKPIYPYTISEKIILFLTGIYFSKELGLNDDDITSRVISENLGIPQTSLSGALGEYCRQKIVLCEDGEYSIKFYEIEQQLNSLEKKYIHKSVIVSPKHEFKKTIYKNPTDKIVRKNKQPRLKNTFSSEINDAQSIDSFLSSYELTKIDLEKVFNVTGSGVYILNGHKGINYKEAHLKGTLLALVAYKIYFNQDEIKSSSLRDLLLHSGVALKNLSTTLKDYTSLIIHKKGPIGSTNTSYKLTTIGLQDGITLIKDIINNTKNFTHVFTISSQSRGRSVLEIAPELNLDEKKLYENLEDFCKYNNLDLPSLRTKFDFQSDTLRSLEPIPDSVRKTLQIKYLLLLGILVKKIYHNVSFNAPKLLKNSHVSYDRLDLLDTNKFYKKYFAKKPKTALQLTFAGETKAIYFLKKFLEGGKFDLE
jgi:hypothetical protein